MEAHDDPTNLDSWLIGQLRAEPPPSRLGELLLDENAAAARIEELEALVAELRAQIPPQLKAVPAGHVLFAPTAHGYAVVEVDGPPPSGAGAARRARTAWATASPFPGDRRQCCISQLAHVAGSGRFSESTPCVPTGRDAGAASGGPGQWSGSQTARSTA